MATVTKRTWQNKAGDKSTAWLLAFTDAKGERHREQFKTKREADARRVEVEGQVVKGTYRAEAAKVTVAVAVDNYIKHLEARHDRDAKVTATYLHTTKAELLNYVAVEPKTESKAPKGKRAVEFTDGIGHVRLAQLTSPLVADLRDRLLAAGVSVSTVRRAIASLSRALSYAIERGDVAVNAAKGVKVIGSRKEAEPKKIEPPTKAALAALRKAADADTRLRIDFAAATGLRASEQWALRWRHLDFANGFVTVEARVDVHGVEDTTKSAAGRRKVPIGKKLVEALQVWRESSAHDGDNDLVFPDSHGGHTRHGNFLKRTYQPIVAGLGEEFAWHALRHYAVSTWIEEGFREKKIQTWAGHANMAITMDRYGHMFASDDDTTAMDRIADALLVDVD